MLQYFVYMWSCCAEPHKFKLKSSSLLLAWLRYKWEHVREGEVERFFLSVHGLRDGAIVTVLVDEKTLNGVRSWYLCAYVLRVVSLLHEQFC